MPEYSKEQLWPLYEKLPEDLKKAIFSVETADNIHEICTQNGLKGDKISGVAKYTGYVLLGILSPGDLEKTLREEVKLKNDLAQKTAWEISRFIFFPVRESLEAIYKIEITSSLKPPKEITPAKKPIISQKDVYREPVE